MRNKLIYMLIGVILLSGCSFKKNIEDIKKPIENLFPKEEKLKIVDLNSPNRPYAVMINNISVARPYQSGLQDAYLIYEIIAEGGITRFLALYQDTDTKRIGSIRSARHYFIDYALENDAIFIHHGQSPKAANDFYNLKVDRIVAIEPKTGWRDKQLNINSEHTLFSSMELLKNNSSNVRTTKNKDFLLKYKIKEVDLSSKENSEKATKIEIEYSYIVLNSYEYDSENKNYKRFINDKAHKDYLTGKQYRFKNIIVIQVPNYTILGDKKGRQDISNIGEFEGYYFTNGYSIPIKAIKNNRNSQTVYQDLEGNEIEVNDGNTFIQIQPKNKKLTIE